MPNPRTKEFPLHHKFGVGFTLQEFETTPANFGTYVPLWFADQAKTEALAQAVQVNRSADNYEGLVTTPAVFMNSRVNKIKVTEYCMVPAAADIPDMMYWKAVITFGLGDIDIVSASGTSLISQLLFEKNADTVCPDYNATNMENGQFLHADVDGLTGDGEIEQVALTPDGLRGHRDGVLGPKIRKMMVGPFMNRVHKDYPFYKSQWYNTPPAAKRANAFTGCFLYVGVNLAKDETPTGVNNSFSPHFQSDLTIDEDSLNCHYLIEFNEYNDSFDQNA